MRIIKFLFKSLLFMIVVAGVGFLLTREILMFMGVGKIKSSLSTLRSVAMKKSYFEKCREKGSVFIEGNDPAIMQLRFISDHEYVLEVLCSQFSIDPIVLEQQQLPLFVKKMAGSSGIVWGDVRSGIALEVFNRRELIGVENKFVTAFSAGSELGIGPVASCVGYGFSCCKHESEQGSGEQFNSSIDCPKTCFSSCVSRPIVLSFNTQPFLDLQKRSVTISSGESVTFSFVIDAGTDRSVSVKLEYGDGAIDAFYVDKQTAAHVYKCATVECSYQVKLSVEDNLGIPAVDLPTMNMVVLVKG